jgi:hypothetical protein
LNFFGRALVVTSHMSNSNASVIVPIPYPALCSGRSTTMPADEIYGRKRISPVKPGQGNSSTNATHSPPCSVSCQHEIWRHEGVNFSCWYTCSLARQETRVQCTVRSSKSFHVATLYGVPSRGPPQHDETIPYTSLTNSHAPQQCRMSTSARCSLSVPSAS